MNFFIFNSNTVQIITLFICTFLSLFLAANFALESYVQMKTDKTHFIENMKSKSKHIKLNYPQEGPDIVFIGNSRVAYHISQEVLKDSGFDVYNFGVSGAKLFSYAQMMQDALEVKPKSIALIIPAEWLYNDPYYGSFKIGWEDLKLVWALPFSFLEKLEASMAFLESLNGIRVYAQPIHSRALSAYHKFDPLPSANQRSDEIVEATVKRDNIKDFVRCNIIDKESISPQTWSYKCSNADLIMEGYEQNNIKEEGVQLLKNPNIKIIYFIRRLIKNVEESGAEFILVLEPHPKKNFSFDIKMIEEELDVPIIDLSATIFKQDMWGDKGHLNHKGRIVYSKILGNNLSKLSIIMKSAEE